MQFHEKLQRLLAVKGRTEPTAKNREQTWLAEQVEKNTTLVGNWYSGKVLPRIDLGLKIARALGVPLDYLADDTQDEPPPPPPDALAAPATAVPVVPPVGPLDDACILKVAHELGLDEALRRLLKSESGPGSD